MRHLSKVAALSAVAAILTAGTAFAGTTVNANISVSTHWTTAGNPYNLVGQIYVLPGASLTIDAGVLVKSAPADQGSLAVCRGAKIYVMGTKAAPVIMTSTLDTMTAWHVGCNEWGNLTLMGNAYISSSTAAFNPNVVLGRTNTKIPDALNQTYMEGLVDAFSGDTKNLYGGGNDDDDSGELHYLSLRYGGKVIGLGNELNGMSMGGIGRTTKVDHIEIMNDVDDMIETWGGTVNYKYVCCWNGGDDGFDYDQGWRGKLQFGLFVQGYSVVAARGSGVSDNIFEMDGAEDSDAQPVSRACIYNCTGIGQPLSARKGTAWRDGNGAQFRNCIFMECGQEVIKNDGSDGDNAHGYGFNGTPQFADLWNTPYTTLPSWNSGAGTGSPANLYKSQSAGNSAIGQGFVAEVTDTVFYNNTYGGAGTAYATAISVGAVLSGSTDGAANNSAKGNVVRAYDAPLTYLPIKSITRGAPVTVPDGIVLPVTQIDPRAAHDAVTSVSTAPNDGFFTQAPFRGAFSKDVNWCRGWTAADAYGMYVGAANTADPTPAQAMTMSFTVPTTAGVVYTVEQSSDMRNWYPIGTITGNGGNMSVTDLSTFDNSKFYRAIAQ